MWLAQWILANFHHTVRSTQNCILYTPGIVWVSQASLRIENSTKQLPADFEHCICWLHVLAQVACCLCGWHNSVGHPNSNDTRGCRLMCHFFVLTTFDVICGLFLNRHMATWNLFDKLTTCLAFQLVNCRGERNRGVNLPPPCWFIVERRGTGDQSTSSLLFPLFLPPLYFFPYFSLLPSFFPLFLYSPYFSRAIFPLYSVPPLSLWLYRKITREGTDS